MPEASFTDTIKEDSAKIIFILSYVSLYSEYFLISEFSFESNIIKIILVVTTYMQLIYYITQSFC